VASNETIWSIGQANWKSYLLNYKNSLLWTNNYIKVVKSVISPLQLLLTDLTTGSPVKVYLQAAILLPVVNDLFAAYFKSDFSSNPQASRQGNPVFATYYS